MNLRAVYFYALITCAVFSAAAAFAQDETISATIPATPLAAAPSGGAVISAINVQGNERVETETVLNYLPFQAGSAYKPEEITEVIRSLYATGLFEQVDVNYTGGTLLITLKEAPLVNKVAFEGNEELADEKLETVVALKSRSVFTPAKAQRDVQEIVNLYRKDGRYLADVRPQLIAREQGRVDVVYNITEGPKTYITRVEFIGNKRFSDSDLREEIESKQTAWYRFLSSNDTYDPARLDLDKELLRRFYLRHGYADFRVVSAVAELARDKQGFYLTYTLTEGVEYNFGKVAVALNAAQEGLSEPQLAQQVTLKSGELYDASRVEKNVDTLVDELGKNGFAFLDVDPTFTRNEVERTVDVLFNVNPGPRVYVNRINFEGNTRTRDKVLRREMRLAEGDAFSSTKLKRSRDRMNYLGFFEKVDIEQKPTEDPDRVDLDVKVAEQSTGEVNVGAGYSTFEGVLANADLRERNFLGRGQDVNVRFNLSERRQNYALSFTEPYFLNQELAAGADLFNEQIDLQDESSYDQDNTGGGLRLRFPVDEFTKNTIRLSAKETKISNLGSQASTYVRREAGSRSSIVLGNTYSIDTRDSPFNPTRGHNISLATDYSGLGGDIDYLKALLSGSWSRTVAEDTVVTLGGRVGAITELGSSLPIYEHFSGGGATLRGFDDYGIGPRDRARGDALGGKYLIGNTVEMVFPIAPLRELGIQGVVFSDGGIVTEFDRADAGVVDSSDTYRLSAGAGLAWRSPIGPLRLEFGVPLVKASEDNTRIFSFSVGTRF